MNNRRLPSIRARRALLLGAVAAVAVGLLAVALSGNQQPARVSAAGGTFDPLAYSPDEAGAAQQAAADGLSQVIYAKSPGGVAAAAARTAAFRPQIEAAARSGPIGADTLEAIVLLESAGRPDVVAGPDPSAAAGLTQIVAQTAGGLLGMRVGLAATRRLTAQIAAAAPGSAVALRARRARADQRFDPAAALAATERYLAIARRALGRDDLAVESYHMGIGNLETALRRFAGVDPGRPIAQLVADQKLSYAQLYLDSTPLTHPAAYAWLTSLGDDSATYLWRVAAAAQIMHLYRTDPPGLARQAALHTGAVSAELALRPPDRTPVLTDAASLAAARRDGTLDALPFGAAAAARGLHGSGPLQLRPDALAAALYIAGTVRSIARTPAPLEVSAAATDAAHLSTAARASHDLADRDRLHATGYAFDLVRSYASPAQALALQFVLDRLQALDVIAWQRHARIIHVVAGPRAGRLPARR